MSRLTSINTPTPAARGRAHDDDRDHPDDPREVRARYAAAATTARDGGCCTGSPDTIGGDAYSALERADLPDAAVLASPRLRQSDRGRRPARRRARARSRLGRWHRRPPVGEARRPDRAGLRARHDRRDAGPGAAQRGRGRRHQRRVPEGHDRGHPAAGRLDRRRHQQLRHQPGRRQAGGLPRDRAGAAARVAGSASPTSSPRTACRPTSARARLATSAASPARCRSPSSEPGLAGRRPGRTSR